MPTSILVDIQIYFYSYTKAWILSLVVGIAPKIETGYSSWLALCIFTAVTLNLLNSWGTWRTEHYPEAETLD